MTLQKVIVASLLIVLSAGACGTPAGSSGGNDEFVVETMVAATMQALTQSAVAPVNGRLIEHENVRFTLPLDIAESALGGIVPGTIGNESYPWWEIAPEHVKILLDRYRVPADFLESEILVFPAAEYAAANEGVATNLQILSAIRANGAAPDTVMPSVPFFNAAEVFASQKLALQFEGGTGVRAVTEYAQFAANINNQDIFYLFEGLTQSGAYYIVAIFHVRAPILPENGNPDAFLPEGGLPFPGYDDPAALDEYYAAVTERLNALTPEQFQPSLATLDQLIESLVISEN